MRSLGFVAAALALVLSSGATAQPWVSYLGAEDQFALGFPAEPSVEETEWVDERGDARFARRYRAERAGNVFSLTTVDFADASYNLRNGSFDHAATVYRHKGEVTYDAWMAVDRIAGHQLQITVASGRRIYFAAYLHDGILYVLDANVSARSAPPGQFQQGIQFLDRAGERVRYTETGERIVRTDDLQEALGGADLDGPILEGGSDEYINQ